MYRGEEIKFDIGAKDVEIPVKATIIETEGGAEVRMEIGRPTSPIVFLDGKAIDDFISKLRDIKGKLGGVV